MTLLPQDSVADAVAFFNEGSADAVSGWEPDIYDAESGGGNTLLSSEQLRIVIDSIVTSRQAIADDADLVQRFPRCLVRHTQSTGRRFRYSGYADC